ncbi:related to 4-cresol dehydrogenase flavoprotein subunit [Cephalotrichum gorgonifer]|uniref:Related to 4-cresol dehydrogenase flavoprotein subunit n=1 Tax=Cephalotrichum gorgonifer TaxID=2041049 RepID=A0AAE8N7J4_9PEZI|nr:related to 4-cresol dehydrogenase flavoprotein subunit [Cephalotrichum gorgonifer]
MVAEQKITLALVPDENALAGETVNTWVKTAERVPTLEIIPPGLDAATWAQVLTSFREILGEEGVLASHDHRVLYADPYAELQDEGEQAKRGTAATLYATTVEHIQAILKICNEHKIPLWTVSRGRNLGYGGPAARVKGSIILDLQRMNKILDVNDKYSYYTVEPGVTFFDIYRAIREKNANIWCSCPALGWGSIVGNALDRGWGYTPAGDHSNQICGIEVVLADGTVVRTGMGALNDSACWPLFRGGYGPTYEQMFSQSNFGIVTKMSIQASPAPEGYMLCHLDLPEEDDLIPMTDVFRQLLMADVIQNHPIIGNIPREMAKKGPRSKFYTGEGPIPDARLKEIQKELGVGYWSARFGLYGPKEIIDYNYKRCQQAFAKIPGARVWGTAFYPPEGKEVLSPEDLPVEFRSVETGTPSLIALKSVQYRGKDGGHVSFSPILPPDGKAALEFYYAAKECLGKYGFEFFGGLHQYPRHLAMINMIYFDRQSKTERENANKVFVELVHLARKFGYSEYRAHVDYMDLVADQFDFNGKSLMKLNEAIKDALDPNGILSPGKQGIWDEKRREAAKAPAPEAAAINGALDKLAI